MSEVYEGVNISCEFVQDFRHPGVDKHTTVWSLTCLPQLREFVHAVTDANRRQVVQRM